MRVIICLHAELKKCVQKVGSTLSKYDTIKEVFGIVGDVVKTADFISAGLSNYDVAKFCKEGFIERIKPGFYQFPQNHEIKEETLLAKLLPHCIICVESALFHYGYSDFTPREWTIAVPRYMSRAVKQMPIVALKAYYIQKEYFDLGKAQDDFNGVQLAIYDRERTICDCFKYRTKLDSELFNKAINAYAVDERKNLVNLSKYAKQMQLYGKVMNVMEVLLNA